jgi:putative endonuclease
VSSRGEVGRRGEQIAADYLRARGYAVVTTNWRSRFGELDLVATYRGQVVFVEVRSRSTATVATAEESVGPDKQRRLLRMAESYLQQHAPNASARIDVVTVYFAAGQAPAVRHIVGAVSA